MKIGSKLCLVSDLGVGEYMYGGRLLELLGEQGAIYALKLTGEKHMLGYRFDEVVIRRPVRMGEVVDFFGENPQPRTTSVTFDFRAECGGEVVLTARCTYVAIDPDGHKKPLNRCEE